MTKVKSKLKKKISVLLQNIYYYLYNRKKSTSNVVNERELTYCNYISFSCITLASNPIVQIWMKAKGIL